MAKLTNALRISAVLVVHHPKLLCLEGIVFKWHFRPLFQFYFYQS